MSFAWQEAGSFLRALSRDPLHWLHPVRVAQVTWNNQRVKGSREVETNPLWRGDKCPQNRRETNSYPQWHKKTYRRAGDIRWQEQKRCHLNVWSSQTANMGEGAEHQEKYRWQPWQGVVRQWEQTWWDLRIYRKDRWNEVGNDRIELWKWIANTLVS